MSCRWPISAQVWKFQSDVRVPEGTRQKLLELPGVHDVFANEGATGTWFAVTRQPGTEWQSLAPMVRDFLQELPENDSKLAEGLEVEGTTEGLEGAEEIIRIFMLSVGNPKTLKHFVPQVTSVRSEEDLDVDATNPYADLPWTHHGEPAKEPGRMLMQTLDDQDFTCMVSVLTGPITSQTPLKVVREAVSLVSKFFLQNLQTLQRHDCFGQLWLMVLRLMLQFIKRGSDDQDCELEEVATETLKNLLGVLVSTKILGFMAPKVG
eukprot:g24019.t1